MTWAFALSLGALGCGPNPGRHIRELIEGTKRQSKAADVRAALVPFFSYEGKQYADDASSITNQLPKLISSLPIFSDNPNYIDVDRLDHGNRLMLTVGSGHGHWGIAVLRPGYDEQLKSPGYILWDDGVYFFSDYKLDRRPKN